MIYENIRPSLSFRLIFDKFISDEHDSTRILLQQKNHTMAIGEAIYYHI